ncbi:axin-like isoform X1 [Leptidea sinapis]|uniref:axin-like isoform X1 n=2 Tax=Leptidea sinapis TaxID=189913 RepID=UPI002129274B|nr:axin-like isoform X1 [Leptidea sinapis]
MSHSPDGGHPQGWEHKLADRSSLPPAPGEEKTKSQSKHVFAQPHGPKTGAMWWREETEGSSGSTARSPATSPPYVRWARALHYLLEDAEGVRLFRKFVCGAGGLHVDRLNFYFAVHGLRQETEPAKIRQVVSAIYKFLRKSQLAMPEQLKTQVKQALKDTSADIEKTIFDDMEHEVTRAITETTYQSFLRSEAYVSYVSAATQPLSSPDASPPHHREMAACGLATLHEGQELSGASGPTARLTHDALLATQSRRLQCDVAPHRKRSVYNAHVTYAGYTPTSRQDSERASLSSGRTDSDAVSLSGSSV